MNKFWIVIIRSKIPWKVKMTWQWQPMKWWLWLSANTLLSVKKDWRLKWFSKICQRSRLMTGALTLLLSITLRFKLSNRSHKIAQIYFSSNSQCRRRKRVAVGRWMTPIDGNHQIAPTLLMSRIPTVAYHLPQPPSYNKQSLQKEKMRKSRCIQVFEDGCRGAVALPNLVSFK